MDHYCVICKSPFLPEGETVETETVATTCGHVFHRDCVAQHAARPGATCHVCRAPLREGNKFKKIFLTYDEDEQDRLLMSCVESATSAAASTMREEYEAGVGEEELNELRELHVYNQMHLGRLDRQLASVQALCSLYEDRLRILRRREAAR